MIGTTSLGAPRVRTLRQATLAVRSAYSLSKEAIDTMWGVRTGAGFMNGWTIFYWGWWISWAPFVGMFIARISRGRTVGQVIRARSSPRVCSILLPHRFGLSWNQDATHRRARVDNASVGRRLEKW